MLGDTASKRIDDIRSKLEELSQKIWENPETAYMEVKASGWCADLLREHGFSVEQGAYGIPTAIRASCGTGRPVIGFLAEYDALPGLSQAVATDPKPLVADGPGHGCGHNLIAAAHLGGVIGIKEEMEQSRLPGTIVYFGCPAEEVGTGKQFMARAGAFDGLDMVIHYHPGMVDIVGIAGLSLTSCKLHFKGTPAHAGSDPQNGRSALDAIELTNVGANYLREHVPTDVRIHYVITDGGIAPNIVPDKASVWYFIRAPKQTMAVDVYNRLQKVAQGAALMTETQLTVEYISNTYEPMDNPVFYPLVFKAFEQVPQEPYTEEELAFAHALNDHNPGPAAALRKKYGFPADCEIGAILQPEAATEGFGSTDVGDVQHIVPGIMFRTSGVNIGATGHSWQITACSGHSIGRKGMIRAAKIMAVLALQVLQNPAICVEAHEVFLKQMDGQSYLCPLPPEAEVPRNQS